MEQHSNIAAVFKEVETFNTDFVSRDSNRTRQNAFTVVGHALVILYAKEWKWNEKQGERKSNVQFFILKICYLCDGFMTSSNGLKCCFLWENLSFFVRLTQSIT